MKKKYIVPAIQIKKFHVDDIMEPSKIDDVLTPNGINDAELGHIEFGAGNTLQSIDYRTFAN